MIENHSSRSALSPIAPIKHDIITKTLLIREKVVSMLCIVSNFLDSGEENLVAMFSIVIRLQQNSANKFLEVAV